MLKCIDLFSGAGGLSLGLSFSGFESVIAVEIEKDFAETFKINHPKTMVLQKSISDVNFKTLLKKLKINQIDLLCGGPPCQGFSTVGKKQEKDKRNSLFWEFLRAVKETKPRVVLFENVSGFKSLYKGAAFDTLVSELNNLGYTVQSEVLNSADYGAPQTRKRTIVIGVQKGLSFSFPEILFTKEKTLFTKKYLSINDAISDMPSLGHNDSNNKYLKPRNDYQARMRKSVKTLTEHNSSNYGERMKEILSLIPKNGSVKDLPDRLRPKSCFGNTYARLDANIPSPTITRNFGTPSSSRCIHPFQNRALSTREGARIQGYPDNYYFFGSKTSKNLQIGNSVPVSLAEALGAEIFNTLNFQ
tara:strand:- start:1576 stop:2652 length:1077 start_codon:yes stop_codon:yes gene_type:complete